MKVITVSGFRKKAGGGADGSKPSQNSACAVNHMPFNLYIANHDNTEEIILPIK